MEIIARQRTTPSLWIVLSIEQNTCFSLTNLVFVLIKVTKLDSKASLFKSISNIQIKSYGKNKQKLIQTPGRQQIA